MQRAPIDRSTMRAEIVRSARNLIQTRSYLGFSFQDIADEVGLRKASVHHHFPSKELLGIAVMQEAIDTFEVWTATTPDEPHAKLEAYIQMYRNSLKAGQSVCPAGAFAPGWDCIGDDLRSAVRDLRTTHLRWLTGVLDGLAGTAEAGSSSELAAFAFATCQGALVSARMTARVEDFDEAILQLRNVFAHLI